MQEQDETEVHRILNALTPSSLEEFASTPEPTLNQVDHATNNSGDDTFDDSSTDATESDSETDQLASELHPSTVSLTEEFDFEVVGHGGDFMWAQGQRKQSITNVKPDHDGIENRNGLYNTDISSPYATCSTTPTSLPSSPTVQKKGLDAIFPPEGMVTVSSIPTCQMGDKEIKIGTTRTLPRIPDSVLEKGRGLGRTSLKSITDWLNTLAWIPYPFALYTIHVCLAVFAIGSAFLLLPLYHSFQNVSARRSFVPEGQRIVVDQDFPVPTGIFHSNSDNRHVPATYMLLEGWDQLDDTVYRFRISAKDLDGKPRRQGLDYVSAVVTLTPHSSDEGNRKNTPILLRARGDPDGSYTFAVSDPSGAGTVVVDIYAATRAQIEKAGLKHGAGVGYQIEGSPFVIRGNAVNDDESENEKLPRKGKEPLTVAWNYIHSVMPHIKLQNLKSQIQSCVNQMSEPILDATARIQTGAQMLNNRVFNLVIAAKKNVATFVKGAIQNPQELVKQDRSGNKKDAKETAEAGKVKPMAEHSCATKIRMYIADLRDRVYGNAKSGFKQVTPKVPLLISAQGENAQPEKVLFMKKAQKEFRKLGSYFEAKRKQIAETTREKGNEIRKKVESSFIGFGKWAQDGLAVGCKSEPAFATEKKGYQTKQEEESSWMSLRRSLLAFTGRQF